MEIKTITANRTRAMTSGLALLAASLIALLLAFFATDKPAQASFPGKNGKLALASDSANGSLDIWTMNSDGSSSTNLTKSAPYEDSPAYSPDGRKIAYELRVGVAGIYVMNADGVDPRLVKACGTCHDPAWSPDGKRIAYWDDDGWIYTMRTDGTDTRQIVQGRHPQWSPDGTKVSFARQANSGYWWVYYVPASGGQAVQVTPSSYPGGYTYRGTHLGIHSWSPDSSNIVYTTNEWLTSADGSPQEESGLQIFRVSLSGGKPAQLTIDEGVFDSTIGMDPVYSPDGTKIAFRRIENGANAVIHILNTGDGTTRAVNNAHARGYPSFDWQPTDVPALDILLPPPPDATQPTIRGMSPKKATRDTTPTIKAKVADNTNLQRSDIKLSVARKNIKKFSYNADTGQLKYTPRKRLSKGKTVVKIVATDAAGNVSTKSWRFKIR